MDNPFPIFIIQQIVPWIFFIFPITVIAFLMLLFFRVLSWGNDRLVLNGRATRVELITITMLFSTLLWGIYIFYGGYVDAVFRLYPRYLNTNDGAYSDLPVIEMAIRSLPWTQMEGRCYTRSPGACRLVDDATDQGTQIRKTPVGNAIISLVISIATGYFIVDSTFKILRRDKTQTKAPTR